jgi:hypothetical protein
MQRVLLLKTTRGIEGQIKGSELQCMYHYGSRGSSVGVAMGYRLDDRGSILGRSKRFSLLQSIQTDSAANPAPYPMGT